MTSRNTNLAATIDRGFFTENIFHPLFIVAIWKTFSIRKRNNGSNDASTFSRLFLIFNIIKQSFREIGPGTAQGKTTHTFVCLSYWPQMYINRTRMQVKRFIAKLHIQDRMREKIIHFHMLKSVIKNICMKFSWNREEHAISFRAFDHNFDWRLETICIPS